MLLQCRQKTDQPKWTIANESQGLCVPVSGSAENTIQTPYLFDSLLECQQFARPGFRELKWNLVNSQGYGPEGQVVGVCTPTLDPYAMFSSGTECASSDLAQYTVYPDPNRKRGWICTNPVLNQCMETQNVNVPFDYKVYETFEQCKTAPENNLDSSYLTDSNSPIFNVPQGFSLFPTSNCKSCGSRWYMNVDRGRCERSFLNSAPFVSEKQCQEALGQCNSGNQAVLQYNHPLTGTNQGWRDERENFRNGQLQVPINPPDKVPIIGRYQITPGLAGQGYDVY
jgi:hypothetical protein